MGGSCRRSSSPSAVEKPSVSSVVLDSSAILALLAAEPGADIVSAALDGAVVSAVNIAEVVGKLIERQAPRNDALEAIRALELTVIPFDADQAEAVGALRGATRNLGLSLGDRACLELARRMKREALSADRSWVDLDIGIPIRMIR
jgi:ribonuclease VapC